VKRTKPRRLSEPDEDLPPEASLLRYIESSALVAAVIERDAEAMSQIHEIGCRVASALTFAESSRAVIRARVTRRITPREERAALRELRTVEAQSTVLAVSRDVLTRASKVFPVEPIRTLDAIHLATLESLGETPQLVTVITRDERIARNARALGYAVV
jgi:predicted nucleic acid-binding protein